MIPQGKDCGLECGMIPETGASEETQLGGTLITMHLYFPKRVLLPPSTGRNEQHRGLYYCRGQAALS
jgi:hypothetical protein